MARDQVVDPVSPACHRVSTVADWDDITTAVGLAQGGDEQQGRVALSDCWEATTLDDHARRCVIAHYLADLQSSLDDEVAWDEAALSEHASVVDEDLAPVGITAAASLAPSLHLNLGDGYLPQGRVDERERSSGPACKP